MGLTPRRIASEAEGVPGDEPRTVRRQHGAGDRDERSGGGSLRTKDLHAPAEDQLRRALEDLLDRIIIEDPHVTRREEQLDQICDLLLLKLHSDKQALEDPGARILFRPLGSPERTAGHVREAFARFAELGASWFGTGSERKVRLGDETIHRCVQTLAPMRLADAGVAAMSVALQALRTEALKQGEGQYFTPPQVIRAAVQLLQVGPDDVVVDPACGTGGFLAEVLAQVQAAGRVPGSWAAEHLFGIDKDAMGVKLTRVLLQMASGREAQCWRGDAVRVYEWPGRYPGLASGGVEDGRFSVVVTNPPFGVNLRVSAADARRGRLDLAKRGKRDYDDLEIGLLFLQRAYQLLRVGGRLGIILPETYFFSEGYRFVLEWLRGKLEPRCVANIPMEAFQGFCRAKTNFYVFEKVDGTMPHEQPVVMLNPRTCGIDKAGGRRFKVDLATGMRTAQSDDELGEQAAALKRGDDVAGLVRVGAEQVRRTSVLVPRYYDERWTAPFRDLCRARGWRSVALGELEEQGAIRVRAGHGSPPNDMRDGHIPYVKVSDLRGLRVNVNPTNLVTEAVARTYWRGPASGLAAWDLITPGRASANIGEFAVLMPGEERVVLTKEVIVLRSLPDEPSGYGPFYLLWALSLDAVRRQWQRVTLMQTNREDVGRRYREICIPAPASAEDAQRLCAAFRQYFEGFAEARTRFRNAIAQSSLDFIASVGS